MYQSQQEENAQDSDNSSFWSNDETEDEEKTGKTQTNSTEGNKEAVKSSDSEEVIERFVGDDSTTKKNSPKKISNEELLKKQSPKVSKFSGNRESSSWEECSSNEEEDSEGEIQNEEDISRQKASKKESSDSLNSTDDEAEDLGKTRKCESSLKVEMSRNKQKKWKDFSDDSSLNVETSSEDEGKSSVDSDSEKCGRSSGEECDNVSENSAESSENTGPSSNSTGSEDDKMIKEGADDGSKDLDCESVRKTDSDGVKKTENVHNSERIQTTKPETERSGFNTSSENTRNDKTENVIDKISGGEERKFSNSSQGGDFCGENGKTDTGIQDTAKETDGGPVIYTSKLLEGNDQKVLMNKELKDSSKNCCAEEFEAESKSSTSDFTDGSLDKSSSDEIESRSSCGDYKDRKRLKKQDNFYSSDSGDDNNSYSSYERNSRNFINEGEVSARNQATNEQRANSELEVGEKCKVSESDGNGENEPKAKIYSEKDGRFCSDETFLEVRKRNGVNGESKLEMQERKWTDSCGERFETDRSGGKTQNVDLSKTGNVLKTQNVCNIEFEQSISVQNSQFNQTKEERRRQQNTENFDCEGDVANVDCNKSLEQKEKNEQEIVRLAGNNEQVDVQQCGMKFHQKTESESAFVNQEISDEQTDVTQVSFEEQVKKIRLALESKDNLDKVENDGLKEEKDGQRSGFVDQKLGKIHNNGEALERWFGKDEKVFQDGCRTTCESPVASLATSGYGTIRSEKLAAEDDRLTVNEFDKDSLYSFGVCEQEVGELHSLTRNSRFEPENESHVLDDFWDDRMGRRKSESSVDSGAGGRVEAQLLLEEREKSDEEEDEGMDGEIKFIDSKVKTRQRKSYQEWEGNLRQPAGASFLEERLSDLHLTSGRLESEHEELASESPSSESLSDGAFESYVRGLSRSHSDGEIRPKPKSFIRPTLGPTGPKKTDPVAKYFQYKQLWDLFQMPGENDRKALRWEIRERLAYQPPPPKPRKVLVPNTYTVPTDKKRSALRWEIRNDLATGNLPHSYNYRF